MGGVLRGIASAGAWALASGCGPTIVDGPFANDTGSASGTNAASAGATTSADDDDSGSASVSATASETASATASATATETATATATETATATATETATLTATLDDSGTGDVDPSTFSIVSCQDDGTVEWLVRVYLEEPLDSCPPEEFPLSGVLMVGIEEWDGAAGVYVSGDGDAIALYGVEPLTGTFTLDVSAPYEPSDLEYTFTGRTVMLAGSMNLAACSFVDELPCEAGTTG